MVKSVTATEFSNPRGKCSTGGSEFTVGAVSATLTLACNGKAGTTGANGAAGPMGPTGSPWTVGGTLPSDQSEKGAWGSIFTGDSYDPISFTIPLKTAPLGVEFIEEGNTSAQWQGPRRADGGTRLSLCYAGAPPMNTATPPEPNVAYVITTVPGGGPGAGTTGAIVVIRESGAGSPPRIGRARGR